MDSGVSHINPAKLALAARIEILKITHAAKASHVASALSVVDILSVLYTGGANVDPSNIAEKNRDIVILSKGHSAAALYSILALQNFFPIEWLSLYSQNNGPLGGHVTAKGVPGVELSTGSLGHGLPYGLGIALARKREGIAGQVIVVMSDGECDEGTVWESALVANHHELDNLTVFIDRNRIQSLEFTENVLKLEPLDSKWNSFGWETQIIDGHNHEDISGALMGQRGPKCIIANTTKGKGVKFMENSILWHYRPPSDGDLIIAIQELKDNFS